MLAEMPGTMYSGPWPALTPAQAGLAERLRSHVRHLTETIGPRNFKFYEGLQQSADWLEAQLRH